MVLIKLLKESWFMDTIEKVNVVELVNIYFSPDAVRLVVVLYLVRALVYVLWPRQISNAVI